MTAPRSWLCAALLAAAWALPACAEVSTVTIGWLRSPNDVALTKARGSLERVLAERGVTVKWAGPYAASAPAMEAVNGGSIDITTGSSTSSITSMVAGIPMVLFGYHPMTPNSEGIVVPVASPIQSIKDLAGHTVAVNRGGTGEYLLVRALEKNGVDLKSVKRIYLTPGDSATAMQSGHVDAWATWDPYVALAVRNYGARVIANGTAIGSENAIVWIANGDFARKNPVLLKLIYDTLRSENTWSLTHQAEAGDIWAKEIGVPPDMALALGETNATITRGLAADDVEHIGHIADWYVAEKIVPSRPDVAAGVLKLGN